MKTFRSKTNLKTILTSGSLSLAMLAAVAATSGCSRENESDRMVASALACLDTATNATTVDTCTQKISGVETPQAYLIRCSANFIAQGLTGTRLANAFQQQKNSNNNGSSNQTLTMAAYLVFSSSLTGHTASDTLSNCNKSLVPSVIGLASMVQVATTIASFASVPGLDPNDPSTFDPNAIKTNVTNLLAAVNGGDANAVQQESAIGQAALSAQSAYCGTGSALSTQDICTQLNKAINSAGGDTANIGHTLLQQLSQ